MTGRCCIQEVERNLARRLPQAQPLWERFLAASSIPVVPRPRHPVARINAKDEPAVAAAVATGAEYEALQAGNARLTALLEAHGIEGRQPPDPYPPTIAEPAPSMR